MQHIVVVGASLAGVRAVETLRTDGFAGKITVIGSESHMPYDRPPLSKKFLAGEWDADRVALRKPEVLAELNAIFLIGTSATQLDVDNKTITLSDGSQQLFDGLIIATGGVAKHLPIERGLAGVHVLRTLDDADALRNDLGAQPNRRVVVIGAGFIGLEAAATAQQLGCQVTVLEGFAAPLMRGLGAEMGAAIGEVHRRHGVDVRCDVRIAELVGDDRVTGVRLESGEVIAADVVIVGIGVAPATEWLNGSGLTLNDGVVCDEFLCAGPPTVAAAGDVARWPNAMFSFVEPTMRVEHWTTAAEQGAAAAKTVHARLQGRDPEPFTTVPFFWSDQFDARIQFLGRASADSIVDVVAGSPAEGKWCAVYSQPAATGVRLAGVLGVSMPKLVMPSRALLQKETSREEALAHFAAMG